MKNLIDYANTGAELEQVLIRNGFVRCDIAACNCGSWHPRYGYKQKFDEIKEELDKAGYAVKENFAVLIALKNLIKQRDDLLS